MKGFGNFFSHCFVSTANANCTCAHLDIWISFFSQCQCTFQCAKSFTLRKKNKNLKPVHGWCSRTRNENSLSFLSHSDSLSLCVPVDGPGLGVFCYVWPSLKIDVRSINVRPIEVRILATTCAHAP